MSGEIIAMTAPMSMVFEVMDLSQVIDTYCYQSYIWDMDWMDGVVTVIQIWRKCRLYM